MHGCVMSSIGIRGLYRLSLRITGCKQRDCTPLELTCAPADNAAHVLDCPWVVSTARSAHKIANAVRRTAIIELAVVLCRR